MKLYRLVFALLSGLFMLGAGAYCPAASLDLKGSIGGSHGIARVSGNTAYVSEGSYLVILDITDRDHLKRLSRLDLGGEIVNFDLAGSMVFCLTQDGKYVGPAYVQITSMHVVSAADPAHPLDRGRVRVSDNSTLIIAASATQAIVSFDYSYVQLIDATNPAAPKLGAKISSTGRAAAAGKYLFVLDYDGLRTYALDGAKVPTLKSTLPGVYGDQMAVHGSRLYVLNGLTAQMVDIANPEAPKASPGVNLPQQLYDPIGMGFDGQTVLVQNITGKTAALDTSLTVQSIITCDAPQFSYYYQLGFSGGIACLPAKFGYKIIDYSNALAPRRSGAYDLACDSASAIAMQGSLAYIAGERLSVVDLSNPKLPEIKGSVALTSSVWSMELSGNLALMMSGYHGRNELQIFDVSNPAAPALKGRWPTAQNIPNNVYYGQNIRQFAVSGSRVYLTDGSQYLSVLDISSPKSPTLVKKCILPDKVLGILMQGTQAEILAANSRQVYFYDFSNPLKPAKSRSYTAPGDTVMRQIPGTSTALPVVAFADANIIPDYPNPGENYLIYAPRSLNVIDWGNAIRPPASIGQLNIYCYNTVGAANNLCFAYGKGILSAVDLTYPQAPVQSALFAIDGFTNPMAADGSRVLTRGYSNYGTPQYNIFEYSK